MNNVLNVDASASVRKTNARAPRQAEISFANGHVAQPNGSADIRRALEARLV